MVKWHQRYISVWILMFCAFNIYATPYYPAFAEDIEFFTAAQLKEERERLSSLVNADLHAFETFDRQAFVKRIMPKAQSGETLLIDDIESKYVQKPNISFRFTHIGDFYYSTDPERGLKTLNVHFTWEKIEKNNTCPVIILGQGAANFHYVAKDLEWLLEKIDGDDPFTVR